MKDKICIIGGFRLPEGNASAVRAFGNALLLQEIGYQPVIVGKLVNNSSNEKWQRHNGFECYNIECKNDKYGITVKFAEQLIDELGADQIHSFIVYNFPGVGLERLRRIAFKNGIAIISDTTEWYAFEGDQLFSAILRKLQTEYRMRIVNKRIKNIICSTFYIANFYKKCHTIVIPMIDDQTKTDDLENDFTHHDVKRFIYAGSPGYKFQKDKISTIIKGFQMLQEKGIPFRLDIYGIDEKQYNDVYRYHSINDDQCKIVFHGRVPKSEIEDALKETDFYVLYRPNNRVCRVGFSTKAMEAVSHGVPLIANDVNGDFRRYFTDRQALICDSEDEKTFFSYLERAAKMSDEDIKEMKNSCIQNNPFHCNNFLKAMDSFMSQVSNLW